MINIITFYKFNFSFLKNKKDDDLIIKVFISELKNFFLYKKEEIFINYTDNNIKIIFDKWNIDIKTSTLKYFPSIKIDLYILNIEYLLIYNDLYQFIFESFDSYLMENYFFEIYPFIKTHHKINTIDNLSNIFYKTNSDNIYKNISNLNKHNIEDLFENNALLRNYLLFLIYIMYILLNNEKDILNIKNELFLDKNKNFILFSKRLELIQNLSKDKIWIYKKILDTFFDILYSKNNIC